MPGWLSRFATRGNAVGLASLSAMAIYAIALWPSHVTRELTISRIQHRCERVGDYVPVACFTDVFDRAGAHLRVMDGRSETPLIAGRRYRFETSAPRLLLAPTVESVKAE